MINIQHKYITIHIATHTKNEFAFLSQTQKQMNTLNDFFVSKFSAERTIELSCFGFTKLTEYECVFDFYFVLFYVALCSPVWFCVVLC